MHPNTTAKFIKLSLIFMIACSLVFTTSAVEKAMEKSTLDSYQSTENTILKKKVLQTLSDGFSPETDVVAPWKVTFLRDVLQERSPLLVEEASHQIGNLHIQDLTQNLIVLFNSAEEKYQGYSERVQIAIVNTLGKTGGTSTTQLFTKFLENDNGAYLGYEVLAAIKQLNNPVFIDCLNRYALKMDARIAELKTKNANPIFYSKFMALSTTAKDIEKSLVQLKEGDNEK